MPVIASTYETDREESRALLIGIVDRVADPALPVDFVYRLADASDDIWPFDGELVRQLYEAVFTHVETSEDRTLMLPGVVALTSTRRQDFGMAQYVLIQHLPAFLREAPESAIPASLAATNATALVREVRPYATEDELPLSDAVREFPFRGSRARILPDRSHFWDGGGVVQHDAHELFDSIAEYVQALIENHNEPDLERFLDLFAEHALVAFAWRRLLTLGSQQPNSLGMRLEELLVAPEILFARETVREAGLLMEAVLPMLEPHQRLRIEEAISRFDAGGEADYRRSAALRLIARFTEEALQTPQGHALYEQASGEREAVANPPFFSIGEMEARTVTREDWLTREGIDVSSDESQEVLRLGEPLDEFARAHLNAIPADDAVGDVVPHLSEALAFVTSTSLEPALEDASWAAIGNAASIVSRAAEQLGKGEFELCRQVLLECAHGAAPRARVDPGSFDYPMWSSAARNEAAAGLPRLYTVRPDAEMRQAMLDLSQDPVPSVRFLLASELFRIEGSDAATFWELAALYVQHESNSVVLDGAVGSLAHIASVDNEPLVVDLLGRLLDRGLENVGREHRPEDQLSSLIVGLALGRGNKWALAVVRDAIAVATDHPEPLRRYLWSILQFVSAWRADVRDLRDSFERGVDIVEAAVSAALTGLERTIIDGDPEAVQTATAFVEILDEVVARLYFQSGVYASGDQPRLPQSEICTFFDSIRHILMLVAQRSGGPDGTGLPARTTHYLVELLRGTVSCDPPGVVHLTRLVVEAGRGAGYTLDPLAEREVVALIETILADHREDVREGAALEDLMALLDLFVDVGSPDAQRLVWRLEELFR